MGELACLVSEPGAERQPLHSDTQCPAKALVTSFLALQDVEASMGPTVVCPGTHRQEVHDSFVELPLDQRSSDSALDNHGGVPVLLEKGSVLVMDSRLLHCGGANTAEDGAQPRRRLL